MLKVGFIGIGSQGGPMARRIADAGLPLTLWARRPEALSAFADLSFDVAATISDLAARVEHVGVCVVNDADTRDVCAQLIPAMRAGSRIAVHSTVHPQTVRDIAAEARERGIVVLDAPVSGGAPGAAAGKLTVMLGGDEAACAAAKPVFDTFASLIVRLGDVGAGQVAKLINNSMMAVHVAIAHHATQAGIELGLERAALNSIINASSGRSFGFEIYARWPGPQVFQHGAMLLAKDVRLLGDVMGDAPTYAPFRDVAMPFLDLVQQMNARQS